MKTKFSILLIAGSVLGLLFATGPARADATSRDAKSILQAFENVALDLDGARSLTATSLDLGVARLEIGSGTLVPTTAVGDQVREWLFIGTARLLAEPPDAVEAQQLELYTDKSVIDEPVSEAVLVLASDSAIEALEARPAIAMDPDTTRAARELFARWRSGGERAALRVEEAVLLDVLGDPLHAGYFAGLFRGEARGDFLCVVEPDAHEPVTFGRFVPVELSARQKRRAAKAIAKQQRKGRWIGLEIDALGAFENWMSMPLRNDDGAPRHGHPGFDVEHFDLDVALTGKRLTMDARATIRLAVDENLRGLRFRLSSSLEVTRVSDTAGNQLFHRQKDGELLIVTPETTPDRGTAGSVLTLQVDYNGTPVTAIDGTRAWTLDETTAWYPNPLNVDLATFDTRFEWPKALELFAGGTPEDEGLDGDSRWRRYRVDRPALHTSFEIGKYQVEQRRAGHVDIQFAFDASTKHLIEGDRDKLVDAVGEALTYFEEIFGDYPYDHLTLVTAPRLISQALPAMVTLSSFMLSDSGFIRGWIGTADEDRRGLIAHELAHQWWGLTVAWRSYRDQWISEAAANYAALLFVRNRLGRSSGGPLEGWMTDLLAVTPDGRTVESLGPMVLGARLASSPAPEAFGRIVYKKGAVVLDMLSRLIGEDAFVRSLRGILEAVPGRAISTDDFFLLLERVSGQDLSAFADQFVFGTGLTQVVYEHTIEPTDDGRWRIRGTARQESPFRYRFRVAPGPREGLDVIRETVGSKDVDRLRVVVPVMISLLDRDKLADQTGDQREQALERGNVVVMYHSLIEGAETEIDIELEHEPKIVRFDPRTEVFANFFDRSHRPKQVMVSEGVRLAAFGDAEAAEARLEEALDAELMVGPSLGKPISDATRTLASMQIDERIYRSLCRLYLDLGRTQSAESALKQIEETRQRIAKFRKWGRPSPSAWSILFEARLAMQKGDPESAYDLLLPNVRRQGTVKGREALALLAVAAHRTGREKIAREAAEDAAALGVDVDALGFDLDT